MFSLMRGKSIRVTAGVKVVAVLSVIAASVALASVVPAASLASTSAPTPTWTQQFPTTSPVGRHGPSMAFDAATGEPVLFGGNTGDHRNDTWTYDGTTWTQQFPATSPPGRYSASMAFDPTIGELVLFCGYVGSYRNDTWTYDGTTWTQQFPATSPPVRSDASMAFDPAGELVLFGGERSGLRLGDTWTYDGTTWTQQFPATSPARSFAAMAFSPASRGLVLFLENGDTWTYQSGFPPPIATISRPANHQIYVLDQVVETDFSCAEASGGAAIVSCLDSNGSESPGRLDTSTKGSHSYVVTATAEDGQVRTASIEYIVVKATPVLTTQASPDVRRGKAITDKAVLSSGHSPGGSITFRLYGPHDANCSRAPAFSDVVSVSGNGSYASAPFIAKAPGTYRWVAFYSGDPNNEAVSDSCNDEGESVRVVPACPAISHPSPLHGGRRCPCGFLSPRSQLAPPARVCRAVLAR
jgi:hypothetical protein